MKNNKFIILILTVIGIVFMACEPQISIERPDVGLPPTDTDIDFTITPGDDPYHVVLKNSSTATGIVKWDLGNGATSVDDEVTVHFPDIGTYTITLSIITKSGYITKSIEHIQDVTDPLYGNLVKGSKFETEGDIANWTIQYPDLGNQGLITFADGKVHYDNNPGSWGQATIYQPVEVIADQQYRVDLNFETSGVFNGWFKVYACLTEPVQDDEYKGEILVTEIPIWGEVGSLTGRLLDIHNSDTGTQNNCVVSFSSSGTIWLLVQGGAEDLRDGLYIDNVEFRAYYGE